LSKEKSVRVVEADLKTTSAYQEDQPRRIGLGVDAGGTYTDAVIYDLEAGRLLDKKKAPTTKWDFTVGIGEALAGLNPGLLDSVDLVALSTTLATNAIVEEKGQRVGLLFMPPYGLFKPEDITYEPKALLSGRLEITGEQIQPVNEQEVRRVAKEMVDRFEVKAFAVSGFAGAINPEHERLVKALLRDETGLFVTCGHELSDILDFRTRARTAVMNGRILPLVAQLLEDAENVLRSRGIRSPVVVVKGDGTLMSKEAALERPVETILSGPAASVAGARHLTARQDAIVVDMGGTTTDTAMLQNGEVRVCESGSHVGGKKTHVKALRIRTVGLGGDSFIAWNKGGFEIGPQRVAPMAWLGTHEPGVDEALDFLMQRLDDYRGSTKKMQILIPLGRHDGLPLTAREADIVRLLKERPFSLQELSERIGLSHWSFVPVSRLEEHFIVQRCGLTPTDLLNRRGEISLWDTKASMRMCEMFSAIIGVKSDDMIQALLDEMVKKLALEIVKRQLDEETDPDRWEECEVCRVLIGNILGRRNRDYSMDMKLSKPIVGIGAPVHLFLSEAASLLGAEAILPEHADVANAIGAITSQVRVRRQVKIRPTQAGGFVIEGLPGAKRFLDLEEATSRAEEGLARMVRKLARTSGTTESTMQMDVDDFIHTTASGSQIFLRRTITAELTGAPNYVPSEEERASQSEGLREQNT
jgi:N-methylhydantoinase A/oxoprolinase/acetone carboxylase beta subunit